ncbi:methyltransferase domain-containing protein [Streptomyces sp. NBC_00853]|uniref:methyltransferase domain-containing protein n=1 Tax=Streptomyces sp. NBC_00853 TaxID=2903681 RepID=UPI003872D441|nr:methyltransferase domain-containing protein [Streptomyces sp. NBC_00853]
MDWTGHAAQLADSVTDPDSRWLAPVAHTPRHELVPRWWEYDTREGLWVLRDGPTDPDAWMRTAYTDASVVTRVGPVHADHGNPGDTSDGVATSSSTHPSLVVRMLRHARVGTGLDFLDLGTGAGGLAAYAARRLGSQHVTSIDVDPYLTSAAAERLAGMNLYPTFHAVDASAEIPGQYDRIACTVAMSPGEALRPLLGALREGGRLATTLAGTSLILTGWKNSKGVLVGQIERDWAEFMLTRSGEDYPPDSPGLFHTAEQEGGEAVSVGRYPVLDVANAWEVRSMLEVTAPGIRSRYTERERRRTTLLVHADGSWARAIGEWTDPPTVHQGGPRRLWDILERIRTRLNTEGGLPLYGARAHVTADGVIHLTRGGWRGSMGAT